MCTYIILNTDKPEKRLNFFHKIIKPFWFARELLLLCELKLLWCPWVNIKSLKKGFEKNNIFAILKLHFSWFVLIWGISKLHKWLFTSIEITEQSFLNLRDISSNSSIRSSMNTLQKLESVSHSHRWRLEPFSVVAMNTERHISRESLWLQSHSPATSQE